MPIVLPSPSVKASLIVLLPAFVLPKSVTVKSERLSDFFLKLFSNSLKPFFNNSVVFLLTSFTESSIALSFLSDFSSFTMVLT